MRYKLGKQPAREGAVKLHWNDYVDISALPTPPAKFGHEVLVTDRYGGFPMLCNDILGNCAAGAGVLHQTQLWLAEAGVTVPVSDKAAIENYSAITGYKMGPEIQGFDPTGAAIKDYNAPPNPTDQGTDVAAMLKYWYETGIVDAAGNIHKIGAVLQLEPGNWEQLWYASYYADGVAIGLELDERWQNAFTHNLPWTAYSRRLVEGGHYVVGVSFDNDTNICPVATWGGIGLLEKSGYEQGSDETYALLSQERLKNGVDLEGFNWEQLTADLPKLLDVR